MRQLIFITFALSVGCAEYTTEPKTPIIPKDCVRIEDNVCLATQQGLTKEGYALATKNYTEGRIADANQQYVKPKSIAKVAIVETPKAEPETLEVNGKTEVIIKDPRSQLEICNSDKEERQAHMDSWYSRLKEASKFIHAECWTVETQSYDKTDRVCVARPGVTYTFDVSCENISYDKFESVDHCNMSKKPKSVNVDVVNGEMTHNIGDLSSYDIEENKLCKDVIDPGWKSSDLEIQRIIKIKK